MSRKTTVASALGALAVLVALTGCEGAAEPGDGGPDPTSAAAALADALAEGDLGAIAFTGGSGGSGGSGEVQDSYDEVVAGLGDLTPTVELTDLRDVGQDASGADVATAVLAWSWPVSDTDTWTYTSEAPLVLADDQWQVDFSREVVEPSLSEGTVISLSGLSARRGDVTGDGGQALVTERQVVRVGLDKVDVAKARAGASAERLARLADVDPTAFRKQVEAAGDEAFVEAIVYRTEDVPKALVGAAEAIPGARLVSDQLPLAPTRDFAAPLLGSVGPVTAEMIQDDPRDLRGR